MRILNPDDIPDHRQTWLWRDWIPSGCITLVQGADGCGKSTIVGDICARATAGREMPAVQPAPSSSRTGTLRPTRDIIRRRRPSPVSGHWAVVWVTLEEPPSRVKSRLRLMGADLRFVRIIGETLESPESGGGAFDVEHDWHLIVAAWDSIRAASISGSHTATSPSTDTAGALVGEIVVIDTLLRSVPRRDMRNYQQSNLALQPLKELVNRRDNALAIALNHVDKQGRSGLGSAGIRALTRSVISCTRAPTNTPHQFVASLDRSSFGRAAALQYETAKRDHDIVVVVWGGNVIPPKTQQQRHNEQVAEARDAILTALMPEPLRWTELAMTARALDTFPVRCLSEARSQLRDEGEIRRRRIGNGRGSFTVWYVCGQEPIVQQMAAAWNEPGPMAAIDEMNAGGGAGFPVDDTDIGDAPPLP